MSIRRSVAHNPHMHNSPVFSKYLYISNLLPKKKNSKTNHLLVTIKSRVGHGLLKGLSRVCQGELLPVAEVMNKKSGRRYIWEHLGMMDNPEYIEKNIRKLDIYERNGFLLGESLLLTHETSKVPLSRSVLNSYIENYLL